jgi:hypothetical protein
LFESVTARGGKKAIAGGVLVIAIFLALPLAMKSLPISARETLLSLAVRGGIIDSRNPAAFRNARSALGIVQTMPLYYSTEDLRAWFNQNVQPYTRVLTDRDDLALLKLTLIGAFQPVVIAPSSHATEEGMDALFDTRKAISSGRIEEVIIVAQAYHAELAIVPWFVADAVYCDRFFSVIRVPVVGYDIGRF